MTTEYIDSSDQEESYAVARYKGGNYIVAIDDVRGRVLLPDESVLPIDEVEILARFSIQQLVETFGEGV